MEGCSPFVWVFLGEEPGSLETGKAPEIAKVRSGDFGPQITTQIPGKNGSVE